MFTIRKVQEQMLHEAVQAESNAATADEVVYGKEKSAFAENDPAWVRSAMQRLESKFDFPARKNIRMHCQCGYGMEEKLALLILFNILVKAGFFLSSQVSTLFQS